MVLTTRPGRWLRAGLQSLLVLANLAGCAAVDAKPKKAVAPATSTQAATSLASLPPYTDRSDVQRWIDELLARQPQLTREGVVSSLAQARYRADVARFIMPAATPSAKNWGRYRANAVNPTAIKNGLVFWQEHQAWLDKAEARWGVPPAIVVAILGIETRYGRVTGNFRVVDALTTLAFDFPSGRSDRSGFFRDELEQLLVLAANAGVDASTLRGSYAGAMGVPQFMPSTWLKFAVDFDGDQRIDLHGSMADVIGSVAHYLQAYGWQRGLPTHFAVEPPSEAETLKLLLGPDILPSFRPAEFTRAGAVLSSDGLQHGGLLALVELRNGDEPSTYIAGTENFWAITRYNWSAYYAMAVIELAGALAAERGPTLPSSSPSP